MNDISIIKKVHNTLPTLLESIEAAIEPNLFCEAMKQEFENFKFTILSIGDTEISFLEHQAKLEPIQNAIRGERFFNNKGLN